MGLQSRRGGGVRHVDVLVVVPVVVVVVSDPGDRDTVRGEDGRGRNTKGGGGGSAKSEAAF